MKKILLLSILFLNLFGNNPTIYASLGDIIYDNVENINSLKNLKEYILYKEKIEAYATEVKNTKAFGFEVQSGRRSNLKKDYLDALRELSKVNTYFLRQVKLNFNKAITFEDNELFMNSINSKMIDVRKNKNIIMTYYKKHKNKLVVNDVIQGFLDEEKVKNKRIIKHSKTKKQRDYLKIERLRRNDKLNQEALKNKLEKELEEKKKKIREDQEKELFN